MPAVGGGFIVDSTTDAVDANPGDGTCASAAGECTLRAAIQETNALPGADSVQVPAGTFALTIPGSNEDAGATGDLDITDDLAVTGAGRDTTVIDGGGLDRVFHAFLFLHAELRVEINRLTVQNGSAELVPGVFESIIGGGIFNGDGVSMDLVDVAVRGNHANLGFGGGIYNGDSFPPGTSLTMNRVEISSNVAGNGGGGLHNQGAASLSDSSVLSNSGTTSGGGIENQRSLSIMRSVISGNSAGNRAGIANWGTTTLSLIDSVVSSNVAGGSGGGMGIAGQVSILRSSITGNRAGNEGGGIFFGGEEAVEISDTTISGNSAGTDGAGMYLWGTGGPVPRVANSTVSGNVAARDGGALFVLAGAIEFTNVTIADNSATKGGGIAFSDFSVTRIARFANAILARNAPQNCSEGVASLGHNVEDASSCGMNAAGDVTDAPAQLLPLADNGGPTLTHALPAGSPAIDAANDAVCPAADQRGEPRPLDGNADGVALCDIGAYEAAPIQPSASPTPVPSSAATPGSLPETGGTPNGSRFGFLLLSATFGPLILLALAGLAAHLTTRRRA